MFFKKKTPEELISSRKKVEEAMAEHKQFLDELFAAHAKSSFSASTISAIFDGIHSRFTVDERADIRIYQCYTSQCVYHIISPDYGIEIFYSTEEFIWRNI